MEAADRPRPRAAHSVLPMVLPELCFNDHFYHEESGVWWSVCSCTAVGPQLEHTKEEGAELSSGLVTPCDHGSLSPRVALPTALSR